MEANQYIVRPLDNHEYGDWDLLIQLSSQGTIFHNSSWVKISAQTNNLDFDIIGVFKDEHLIGGCPVYYYLSKYKHLHLFKRKVIVSNIPPTPQAGIVIFPINTTKMRDKLLYEHAIMNALIQYFSKQKYYFSLLVNTPELNDIRPFSWAGWKIDTLYRYVVHLPFDIESVSKNVRRTIHKAEKSGLTIEQSNDHDILWDITKETYSAQGLKPPFNEKYLEKMVDYTLSNNSGELWIAKDIDENILAARYLVLDKDTMHFLVGSSYPKYQNTGVRSYFNYALFLNAEERGYKYVNLMGANRLEFSTFTAGFNPKLESYSAVSRFLIQPPSWKKIVQKR